MPTSVEATVFQFLNKPLSNHAWNGDKSKVAICPNTEEIYIFRKDSTKWVVEDVLKEHDQLITGLDWCPKTNKLISCSMDRNAYVWQNDKNGKWKPTLAALRISKGATCVSWSPDGTKFAVGSSSGSLVVGNFEEENDWWLCKHLKINIENTITSLCWHPNGIDLVVGSIDGSVLVCSGYIKAVDKVSPPESTLEFNHTASSPILDVAFSPSGQRIAYLTHDAKLSIVTFHTAETQAIELGLLPMIQIKFVSENLILTTGHNYSPILIGLDKSSEKWAILDDLVVSDGQEKGSEASAFGSAFAKFKSMDDCGVKEAKSSAKKSGHRNTISKLNLFKTELGKVSHFSTSSFDGTLIVWNIENNITTKSFANLAL